MALGVACQQAAGFGERGLVMQAGEDIEQLRAARFEAWQTPLVATSGSLSDCASSIAA